MFLPIAQRFWKLTNEGPLHGQTPFSNYPTFHLKDWNSGEYQKLVELFLKGNFGFRNTLLRWNNSFDYLVFNKANAQKVIVGKDSHLFFDYNIERYLGIERQDTMVTDSLFVLTDSLRNCLKTRGIEFLYVIAPSNAYYYSDKFPSQYNRVEKKENDYDYYLKKFDEYDIEYVDFNKWFLEIKDTVSIDLFPTHGTHYTYFSAVWVADSLLKYMETLKDIDIPEVVMQDVYIDTMENYEHDLENLLNIGHSLENENVYHYNLSFNQEGKTKPKVLVVGDSFYWAIINQVIPRNCFSNVYYWFYNEKVYPESFTATKAPNEVDLDSLFTDLDYIVVYSSATLLLAYDYKGFIGDMFNYLSGNYTKVVRDERLQYWINAIKNNPDWLNSVKNKARDLNIQIEEQIQNEAEWMVKQENKNK
ncbi:MAG: hypothetical protein C0596_16800 [Marinilabiliales bacterium]|nr:MAG: hypothetical protein C0596_16800 [Marinilabiliales bacterium]